MTSPELRDDVISYFHFWPSKDLAIVALTLFLFASLCVLAVTIRTRCWYMLVATAVGLMEMAGFACRIRMLSKPQYGVYVGMQCLLIIPPSFLALLQYITLGKIVNAIQRAHPDVVLPLKGRLIMIIYFVIEIGSLALQGAGAGLSVSQDSAPTNRGAGRALLIIGLALLVALIISYLANAVYVNVSRAFGVSRSKNLKYMFCALYLSTLLLLTRNIFRLIEFAGGWYGKLAVQEKYFYTLDSLMVLLVLVVSTVLHFGVFFNGFREEQALEFESKTTKQGVQMTQGGV